MNKRLKQLSNLFINVLFYFSHISSRIGTSVVTTLSNIKRSHITSTHHGFTLVEFMIAITLSTFIILGLLSVYSSGKKTYVVQEGLARLQENGRFTTHYMNKIIRMAGYQGCVSSQNLTLRNIVAAPSPVMNFDNAVLGYDATGATWTPNLPAYLNGLDIKEGTDVIEVWQTTDLNIRLSADMANPNAAIVLADPDGDGDHREGIAQDDIFVITDCEVGDIAAAGGNEVAISIAVAASNNTSVSLSKAYTTDAKVLRFDYTAFYIKDTGRTNANGNIIYALVARDIDGNELELADGVEDLQITYGIDTDDDGTADTYQTANTVDAADNWDNVLTVRTAKLLNTVEDVSPAPQSYSFEGTDYDPDDRLLRREWTNLISLRNRNFP